MCARDWNTHTIHKYPTPHFWAKVMYGFLWIIIIFSNVLIGEHVVGTNPDCVEGSSCLPSVQDIEVASVTVHEKWDKVRFAAGNDIALVRLARPVLLSYVSLF